MRCLLGHSCCSSDGQHNQAGPQQQASLLALGQDMNSACTFGVKGLAEMCLNCFPGMPEMLQKPVLEEEREGQQYTPYTASMCLTGPRRWVRGRARQETLDICNTPKSDRQTKGMTGEV